MSSTITLLVTVTIDPKSNWGTWEGWGTSLAGWAKQFGDRDDLADVLFTRKSTSVNSQTIPGLGFNIVRYNAGASTCRPAERTMIVESANIKNSHQVDGYYWQDGQSTDPSSSSWNWSVDQNQRAALQKAIARGANRTELFSNSPGPMWWMCKSLNPSGANDGGENIDSQYLEQHATYMATVAKVFLDKWGIRFETVNPFNEPTASWWKDDWTQKGCHITAPAQATIIKHLASHLSARGLATTISAPDESHYDQALKTLQTIDSGALDNIARIHVHGYQYTDGNRAGLRLAAGSAGKPLWNSAYGDGVESGEDLARYLLKDMRELRPTAWVYCQALDHLGWGLIDAENDTGRLGTATQKYFVLAQFARHVRPGMRILDAGGDNVLAAYDTANSKLVIVAVNWEMPQFLNFDLSNFSQRPADGTTVAHWRTHIGNGDQYVECPSDIKVSGTRFLAHLDINTAQTFEVTGIKL